MRNSGAEYVRSPLLDTDPQYKDLRKMGQRLELELESIVSGDYDTELANENLPRYSFDDSVQNSNPKWWRPRVRLNLEVDDPTVEGWMREVEERLQGGDNYSLTTSTDADPLTGKRPEVIVGMGDYEQKNEVVKVDTPEERRVFDSGVDARHYLEKNVSEREYVGDMPSSVVDAQGIEDIRVDSDLSAGFFQANFRLADGEHSAEVWMPYADDEQALLVDAPSQFNKEADSAVVPIQGEAFTGNSMIDAVSEDLSYFLPFMGIQQPEVSSEAIDYRNENPVGNTPYDVQISSEAWDALDQLDSEYRKRVRDKIDQIAMNPGRTPMELRDDGKFDQVGSNDVFMTWREIDDQNTVRLQNVEERNDAFINPGDRNTRT